MLTAFDAGVEGECWVVRDRVGLVATRRGYFRDIPRTLAIGGGQNGRDSEREKLRIVDLFLIRLCETYFAVGLELIARRLSTSRRAVEAFDAARSARLLLDDTSDALSAQKGQYK